MSLKPLYVGVLVTGILLLGACTHSQSSPERHAQHAVYQLAAAHSEIDTRIQISDSTRAYVPFFDQFYQMGKAERTKGVTRQQAQQQEAYFRSPEFLPELGTKGSFYSQIYTADNPQAQRKILIDGAITTYWDGYEGRP